MEKDFTMFGPWQKAMALAIKIHRVTREFPKEEMYGVTSQLRRAILSVAANIAEGFGRYTYADKMHKYVQARGELTEVMSFLYYCRGVDYLTSEQHDDLLQDCREVQRLVNSLITKMDQLNKAQ
ncbi:MAG: four helix bundle protein [Candidatus Peribacteraceae bacterium]|nr:four helix bundle protein [Candidatus Peribacteraceae bacterium]MDD5740081.1 four helix bundle protein [Candidatus Peribacteraceae bacterium]